MKRIAGRLFVIAIMIMLFVPSFAYAEGDNPEGIPAEAELESTTYTNPIVSGVSDFESLSLEENQAVIKMGDGQEIIMDYGMLDGVMSSIGVSPTGNNSTGNLIYYGILASIGLGLLSQVIRIIFQIKKGLSKPKIQKESV